MALGAPGGNFTLTGQNSSVAPVGGTTAGAYQGNNANSWVSVFNLASPKFIMKMVDTYGPGFRILDHLNLASDSIQIGNRDVYVYEQDHITRNLVTGSEIATAAAGADITFQLLAEQYDAAGNSVLRVGVTILIPQKYTDQGFPQKYRIEDLDSTSESTPANRVIKARPVNGSCAITTAIPAGTEMMVGEIIKAPGTGQPVGMNRGLFERKFSTGIIKETVQFEGGVIPTDLWKPVMDKWGNRGLYNHGLTDMEFRLRQAKDQMILTGQLNTNTNLVEASQLGGSGAVRSCEGLWSQMVNRAQKLDYGGGVFDTEDFVDVKFLLESQGVAQGEVDFGYGSILETDIENSVLDFVRQYSSTDLRDQMSNAKTSYGVNVQRFERNGVKFNLFKLASFANPRLYGNDAYDYTKSGYMIPTNKSKVTSRDFVGNGSGSATLSHFTIGYLNKHGENRTNVMGTISGMNGLTNQPLTEFDITSTYALSEFTLIGTNVNQTILVRPE